MDAMKEVKVWLFSKLHSTTSGEPSRAQNYSSMGPLTPQTIPEFVIPKSNDSSRRTSECSANEEMCSSQRNSFSGRSCRSSPPGSPARMSPSESAPCINGIKSSARASNSAPVTPKHECNDIVNYRESSSTNGLENGVTNVDPLSVSAMSLPHFRAQTSYGFSTLSEMPHTRRKESLFHVGNESLLQNRKHLKIGRENSLSRSCEITHADKPMSLLNGSIKNPPSVSMPSVVVTAVSSSKQNSPEAPSSCSMSRRRLSPTYQAFHAVNRSQLPTRHNPLYNRRRSSLIGLEDNEGNGSTQATSPVSPKETNLDTGSGRRSLGDLTVPTSPSTQKRHSAPAIPSDKENISDDDGQKPRSISFHAFGKTQNQNSGQIFAPFGELKFSFQFLAASQQLKVTLIKAENLGGQSRDSQTVNSYVKTYLMPGKVQKQATNVVKRTKYPVYNQDLYFHNMSLDELHNMALRLKIFSKGYNLKMQEFIGEVTMPLDGYDLLVDNRVWKDLEGRREREPCGIRETVASKFGLSTLHEDLGFISVGVRFEPREGLLHVMVDQAKALPQHQLTGPPDPYVKVEVSQSSHPVSKKQTATKRKTSHPVFDETFTFNISPKMDDLSFTSINILIFDHDRIRSDDVIGRVQLGCGSTEASEFEHWTEILSNPGHLITKWHYLVETDD